MANITNNGRIYYNDAKEFITNLQISDTKVTYNKADGTPVEINLTASNVGLGNVDNISDADKPISTATQGALDNKVNKSGDTMSGTLNANINSASNYTQYKVYGAVAN